MLGFVYPNTFVMKKLSWKVEIWMENHIVSVSRNCNIVESIMLGLVYPNTFVMQKLTWKVEIWMENHLVSVSTNCNIVNL